MQAACFILNGKVQIGIVQSTNRDIEAQARIDKHFLFVGNYVYYNTTFTAL